MLVFDTRFGHLHNAIKDPQWYIVQVCDATMLN